MDNSLLKIEEACKQRFESLIRKIEDLLESEDAQITISIDGMSASGKTSLAFYIESLYDCNLFHMDDFFLQSHQRTPERLNEVGGNVDYERFKREVLDPLFEGKEVVYRPYNCATASIESREVIKPKRLNIIEGSYSQHPYFENKCTLNVFLTISEKEQINRIRLRNGEEKLKRFIGEWIPKENAYHKKFQVKENKLIISN